MKISPYWKSDSYASRKSNISEKKISKFYPKSDICCGVDGINVELIYMTDLKEFEKPLAYMTNATVGGKPGEDEIERIANEMFEGGLQHALENIILIFEISGVSRALTHQLVRHRKWRFHQQSFRWTHLGDENLGLRVGENICKNKQIYEKVKKVWNEIKQLYNEICEADIPFQDARDILPIGTQTYIIAEVSLKDFIDTFSFRGCSYFQQQMVYIMWQMRDRIIEKYPQLEKYIKLSCEKTKKCMYQGWEDSEDVCELEYAKNKEFKSEIYK